MSLADVEMDLVLTLVLGYVRGATLSLLETERVVERTGLTDHEWWAEMAPTLEQVFNPARFPLSIRVGQTAAERYGGTYNPELAFDFGLRRLLDGIGRLIGGGARPRA